MKAQDIYLWVSNTLHDLDSDKRWSWGYTAEQAYQSLQPLLNQAVLATFYQRPDSLTVTKPIQLDPGTQQSISDDIYQLFSLIQNLGADGETPGKGIIKTDHRTMTKHDPAWIMSKSGTEIEHWAYDPLENRKVFWVYPSVPSTRLYVLSNHSLYPNMVQYEDDDFPLPDVYADVVYHHILFQILTADNGDANYQKGVMHFEVFRTKLGIKSKTDAMTGDI